MYCVWCVLGVSRGSSELGKPGSDSGHTERTVTEEVSATFIQSVYV